MSKTWYYRSVEGRGWVEVSDSVHGVGDLLASGEWRPATRPERVWRRLTRPTFSWVELTAILIVASAAKVVLGW